MYNLLDFTIMIFCVMCFQGLSHSRLSSKMPTSSGDYVDDYEQLKSCGCAVPGGIGS